MRRIRSKDTKPEVQLRKWLHSRGCRYRLHAKDLPGKPDLVIRSRKKAVFIHGCFWHQHQDPGCKIARRPKSNTEYWSPKLERNVQRDQENQRKLDQAGWSVRVVWECEIERAIDAVGEEILNFLMTD